jgi:hypothetical protein
MLEAIQEVGARPAPSLPAGPPLFQYSEDAALAELLGAAELSDVAVVTHPFVHRVASTQVLWEGALGSLARTSALIQSQPADVVQRIRHAFDRRASVYVGENEVALPMSFKIAASRRRQPSRSSTPEGQK